MLKIKYENGQLETFKNERLSSRREEETHQEKNKKNRFVGLETHSQMVYYKYYYKYYYYIIINFITFIIYS